MQVAITCRHGSISDEVGRYIRRKSEKLLTYFERVTAIQVTVEFEDGRVSVEILVDAEHRHDFVAEVAGDDVPSSFDRALSKMEQQIRRHKERIQDHRRDVGLNEIVASEIPEPAVEEVSEEEDG